MDIAYYLSELLEQLGEVNVPGLGVFTRVKVDGYYNNEECKFYPPASKLEFSQQYIDDDVLTQFIGVKKRISLASSKYFTEKYITGLKQEIMLKEVSLTDIGALYFQDGKILFKPAGGLAGPDYFGYPQIALDKIGNEPVSHWDETVSIEPAPEPEVVPEQVQPEQTPVPLLQDEQAFNNEPIVYSEPARYYEQITPDEPVPVESEITPDPFEEEPAITPGPMQEEPVLENNNYLTPQTDSTPTKAEDDDDFIFHTSPYEDGAENEPRRSYKWLWISLVVLAVGGGGVFAYFYFQPSEPKATKKVKPIGPLDSTKMGAPSDTIRTIPPAADTSAKNNKAAAPVSQIAATGTIDSTKRRYEVIGASTGTLAEADEVIRNYKSIGLDAHVVSDAPGRRKKISLGTYTTSAEAKSAIKNIKKTGKVKDIWPLTINPKK